MATFADGAIVDSDGAIRGWIHGNTVYDARWNVRYRINEHQVYGVAEDPKM